MAKDNHFAQGRTLSVLMDGTLLVLSAVTTAIPFVWLLYYASYGLNLADEGLYLNFIANPFLYAINSPPSLFGFVYHWPYQWASGNVAVLRMANVTLTMALGWILSFLVICRLWTPGWPRATVLSAGIASPALWNFSGWWLTPSYYSLTFQSLLIVMIGLLLADRPGRLGQILGWVLVGVGGWCCCMAKPTTAAAVALVIMLYLVVVLRRKALRLMAGAALVAIGLVIVTAYLIDGGITGLLTRMINSAEIESLLGAGREVSLIFRIDWPIISRSQLAIAVLLATALLLSISIESMHKLLQWLALAAVLILILANTVLGTNPMSIKPMILFLVAAFTCLGCMVYRKGLILRTQTLTSIALTVTFLILPHLSALGSAGNYWVVGSMDAFFWILAIVAFLSPLARHGGGLAALLPLTMVAQLLTASLISSSILKPFRQVRDLRAYTAVMSMPGGGQLVLSQSVRDYLTTARAQARAAGLEVGMPVVDLTGLSPGLLYVLETRALGLPWLMGPYPGSDAVAVETLGLENCADLAKAWVLVEPEGPYRLDPVGIMASFGAVGADYIAAATFTPPVFDDENPNSTRQFLMKPVRPAALAEQSCREARRQRPDSQKWVQ